MDFVSIREVDPAFEYRRLQEIVEVSRLRQEKQHVCEKSEDCQRRRRTIIQRETRSLTQRVVEERRAPSNSQEYFG